MRGILVMVAVNSEIGTDSGEGVRVEWFLVIDQGGGKTRALEEIVLTTKGHNILVGCSRSHLMRTRCNLFGMVRNYHLPAL